MKIVRSITRRLPRPLARRLGRMALRVSPGIRSVHAQVARYKAAWDTSNQSVLDTLGHAKGPFWVVLGDSTAQGIGAHAPDQGYVGQVRKAIEAKDGHEWRVLNLSRSGARADHVIERQLPIFEKLGVSPDLVTCAIGANDLVRATPRVHLESELEEIISRLPTGAVMATLPQGLRPVLAAEINDLIRARAAEAGLRVADVWKHTGGSWRGRVAADGFHPNASGYEFWAAAFIEALDI